MTLADTMFKENILKIIACVFLKNARPRYKDGNVANSKYHRLICRIRFEQGRVPNLQRCALLPSSAIKEVLDLSRHQLHAWNCSTTKYNVHYWDDCGEVGDTGTIGQRYGALAKKHDIITKSSNSWKPILEPPQYHLSLGL